MYGILLLLGNLIMCGIVGVVVQCDIVEIFFEGLCCLEYCGYDFVGLVVVDSEGYMICVCCLGKVQMLVQVVEE